MDEERLSTLYTLDQKQVARAMVPPGSPDIQRLLNEYNFDYEFMGHSYMGMPVFRFGGTPPDNDEQGIHWIPLYKEC